MRSAVKINSHTMNILFITAHDPRRHTTGAEQRTKMLYDLLAENNDVYTLGVAYRPEDEFVDLRKRMVWHCFAKRFRVDWLINGICRKVFPYVIVPYVFHCSKVVNRYWSDVKFDVVVVRYLNMAAYVTAWEVAPVILDVDDIPSECYSTQVFKTSLITRFLTSLCQRYERFVAEKADVLWICNSFHRKKFPRSRCFEILNLPIVDNCDNFFFQKQVNYESPFLLTVGLLSHRPNYEGVNRFIDLYWSKIHQAYPSLHYKIAGRGLPEHLRSKWQAMDGVEVLGFVESLETLYSECLACVVPVFSGSGTCIKTIEALQHGCFCIATPMGVRGIAPELLCDDNVFSILEENADIVAIIRRVSDKTQDSDASYRIRDFGYAHWNFDKNKREFNNSLLMFQKTEETV